MPQRRPDGFEKLGFYQRAYNEWFLELIRGFNTKCKVIATVCTTVLPLGKSRVKKNRESYSSLKLMATGKKNPRNLERMLYVNQ